VCVVECPAEAIYAEADVPENQKHFIQINAELAKKWPTISEKSDPLPDADLHNGVFPKLDDLDRG
jgi:ferredoxin